MKIRVISAIAAMTLILSCSHKPEGWSISGEIKGDSEYTLALEGFNNGIWYVVDSLRTHDGGFSYNSAVPAAYPEIMRLNLDGKFIYFPVDSVDHINIVADAAWFPGEYTLEGSVQAKSIKTLDSLINASVAERGAAVTAADRTFKQELFMRAFDDPSVMSLFYLANKSVDGVSLFDIANPDDVRFYGVVAQRFANERPDDPRGKFFAQAYTQARSAERGAVRSIEVPETTVIEIERADWRGRRHSLTEMASHGDVVLLNFTAYGLENSPEFNLLLNSLYEKYKGKGLKIYQIAFDSDETFWKETAKNLPWTAVWNSTTDGNMVLANYNVGALPTSFIIDRSGTLAARVEDGSSLEKELGRFL